MEIKRTTEIYTETNRRFVVHIPGSAERTNCPDCETPPSLMITAEHAAALFGINRRAIYRLVEAGCIHFMECESGVLLVCPDSVAETSEVHKPGGSL